MKKLIIAVLLLLLPAALYAIPSIGMYFSYNPTNPGQGHYDPSPGEYFDGFIYIHNWGCPQTAVEFLVDIPVSGIVYTGFDLPEGYLNLGDPQSGISITWYPPRFEGEEPYHLVCTIHFYALDYCTCFGGTVQDLPIRIVDHPDSGGILGTCWPDNDLFDLVGETSIICPKLIGVEETSWGAIKSLFK
jgi:hypothetical protein